MWVGVFSFGWGLVFLIKQWNIYDLEYLLKEIIKMQGGKSFLYKTYYLKTKKKIQETMGKALKINKNEKAYVLFLLFFPKQ